MSSIDTIYLLDTIDILDAIDPFITSINRSIGYNRLIVIDLFYLDLGNRSIASIYAADLFITIDILHRSVQ